MEFNNETERKCFVNDIPYFSSSESFCLGNTLEEAGKVVRQIVKNALGETDGERSSVCGNG